MMVMTAGKDGPKAREIERVLSSHGILFGMLYSPSTLSRPWSAYALDNDCFHGSKKPGWWNKTGEKRWLDMILRVRSLEAKPIFVTLPDVVANWPATVELSSRYIDHVRAEGLRPCVVVQDGADGDAIDAMPVDALFVGGSVAWKWRTAKFWSDYCKKRRIWSHIGQVNGYVKTRHARMLGFDSCDGSGIARWQDTMLPYVVKSFCEQPQMHFEEML